MNTHREKKREKKQTLAEKDSFSSPRAMGAKNASGGKKIEEGVRWQGRMNE